MLSDGGGINLASFLDITDF